MRGSPCFRDVTPLARKPLLLLGWLSLAGAAYAQGAGLDDVWSNLADRQNTAAQVALAATPESAGRPRQLADAVVKLGRQPVTQDMLLEAEGELAQLARGDDELAAQAGYLQARVWQVHMQTPDYARAAELYRELAKRFPSSHWARLGLVKLGLLTLYTLPEPVDPVTRLRAVEALLPAVAEPPLQRDLNLQLARAAVLFQRPETETLVYLKAVDRVGGLVGLVAEETVLQLGELSLRVGRLEESKVYFERFLREFPTNNRGYDVTLKLQEIAARQHAMAQGGQP